MKPASLLKQNCVVTAMVITLIIHLFICSDTWAACTPGAGTVTLPVGVTNWSVAATRNQPYIVPSGATLNVSAIQDMTPNVSITVNVGGVLNLNSGTTLRACNATWLGVIVNGNGAVSQSPSTNQGKMTMTSATIKDAVLGVLVKSGGILTTTNSTFLDNREDVYIKPYNILPPSQTSANVCKFTGTIFRWTRFYSGYLDYSYHVRIDSGYVVQFWGCSFENIATITSAAIRGKGILSFDGSFIVHRDGPVVIGSCTTYAGARSKFLNLTNGVDASSQIPITQLRRKIQIWDCEFTNNRNDIITDKEPWIVIDENTFNYNQQTALFNPTTTCFISFNESNIGTYPTTMADLRVYRNSFTSSNAIGMTFIKVNKTYNNLHIYKNTFTNNYNSAAPCTGIATLDDNTQMQIQCNTFAGFYTVAINISGTTTEMGYLNATAGNLFPPCGTVITRLNNTGPNVLTYYYGTGSSAEWPGSCMTGVVNLIQLTAPVEQNPCTTFCANLRMADNYATLSDEITCSPNPATDQIKFDIAIDRSYHSAKLVIVDLTGKTVAEYAVNDAWLLINIADFKNGMYLYQLYVDNEKTSSGKFIKQ